MRGRVIACMVALILACAGTAYSVHKLTQDAPKAEPPPTISGGPQGPHTKS